MAKKVARLKVWFDEEGDFSRSPLRSGRDHSDP